MTLHVMRCGLYRCSLRSDVAWSKDNELYSFNFGGSFDQVELGSWAFWDGFA